MRLLVAGPPKTGNVWLERLLSLAFGLEWVRQAPRYDFWQTRNPEGLRAFIGEGCFPLKAVCHQHFWPSQALFDITRDHQVSMATTLRHPCDQFVSWYFYIQRFSDAFVAHDDPGQRAIGKPLDHPDVIGLLANEFGAFLDQGVEWLEADRSLVIRYEALHQNPRAVLSRAQAYFGLDFVRPVEDVIAGSQANRMRELNNDMRRHIRTGRVGTWREHLSEAHLKVFRLQHRSRFARLGYGLP